MVEKGEPVISDAAFILLKSFMIEDSIEISLKLIKNPRIDNKQKGMELLGQMNLDTNTVNNITRILFDSNFIIVEKPYQHKGGLFANIFQPKLDIDIVFFSECIGFYSNICQLFIDNINLVNINVLRSYYFNSENMQLKYAGSLILAKAGDCTGVPNLFNEYFINNLFDIKRYNNYLYYRYSLTWFDKILTRKKTISHYAKLTDEVFMNQSINNKNLPKLEMLKNRNDTIDNLTLPEAHIYFLINNYRYFNVDNLGYIIDDNTFTRCFYYIMHENLSTRQQEYKKLINLNRQKISKIFKQDICYESVYAAWLLAQIGDIKVAPITIKAYETAKPGFGFSKYLNSESAAEILAILEKNLINPNDINKFEEIKANLPYRIKYYMERKND